MKKTKQTQHASLLEQKKCNLLCLHQKKRYRRLFETAKEGFLIIESTSGRILAVNPFAIELLEHPYKDMQNKSVITTGLVNSPADWKKIIYKLRKQRLLQMENIIKAADGKEKTIEIIANKYNEDGQQLVQYNIRDISDRKELERRKDDFLSATSHELKTPLTSQKAFIQLLQKMITKNGDQKYEQLLKKVIEQTDKLTMLIQDLLDSTKIQGGKLVFRFNLFDMNECIRRVVEDIQPTTDQVLHEVSAPQPIMVFGDEERISQVLTNLIENAMKFSPERAQIIISTKINNGKLITSIKDTGIGIAKKDLPFLFERFYRVSGIDSKTYPGLGLGLYLSAEIIKHHKGKIWVKSTKGKGSEFNFSLPLASVNHSSLPLETHRKNSSIDVLQNPLPSHSQNTRLPARQGWEPI